MLCDNCRENEATVRYTEIINGNKREMMLCLSLLILFIYKINIV